MKKIIYLPLLIICIISCENDIIPINVQDFTIQQIVTNNGGGYSQTENFSYDVNGKLISISRDIQYAPDLIGYQELIEFQYDDDILVSKTHGYQSTDTLHRQVSFTYLPNGAVHQASHAYAYTGVMEVQWMDTYEYNADGSLRKKTSINPNSTDTEISSQYYWKNGNVSKIQNYNNGVLRYESLHSYDDKINFRKGNPFFSDYDIGLANNNNMIKTEYIDYSGLLDLACNPCSTSYEYNNYNLPTKIYEAWGQVRSIFYEIEEDEIN